MILQPAVIAAQPLLDPQRRLIGAGVRVSRQAFGVQGDFRVEMDGAFGAEPESLPLERGMSGIAAIEIFAHGFGDALAHALAQRVTHVEVLSRDAKCHAKPPVQAL